MKENASPRSTRDGASLNSPASSIPETARRWAEIARLLTLSQRTLARLLTGVAPLSESERMLLWVCSQAPDEGLAQVGLADALGMSPGQVSSLVERLRTAELLESSRSTTDRRRCLWRLTGEGRGCLEAAGRRLAERVDELNSHLSHSEQELLHVLLERVASKSLPGSMATSGRKERAA